MPECQVTAERGRKLNQKGRRADRGDVEPGKDPDARHACRSIKKYKGTSAVRWMRSVFVQVRVVSTLIAAVSRCCLVRFVITYIVVFWCCIMALAVPALSEK